jgi:hypothetical protein
VPYRARRAFRAVGAGVTKELSPPLFDPCRSCPALSCGPLLSCGSQPMRADSVCATCAFVHAGPSPGQRGCPVPIEHVFDIPAWCRGQLLSIQSFVTMHTIGKIYTDCSDGQFNCCLLGWRRLVATRRDRWPLTAIGPFDGGCSEGRELVTAEADGRIRQ